MEQKNGNLQMLPIEMLHPHPGNPRKELGDLTELADSIRAKGIFQNLTVIPGHYINDAEMAAMRERYSANPDEDLRVAMNKGWLPTEYTVIIGHRRRGAAELAGLTHLPCAVVEMTRREQMETMLLENMQREDLTVYEQAQGFQMMIDMGETADSIAAMTGFSKKTVRRRLKMAELDQATLKEVSGRQISLEDFDRLAKIEDLKKRNDVLKSIGTNNFSSEVSAAIKTQEIRRKLPIVKKLTRQLKAEKISRSAAWGNEYTQIGDTIYLKDWDGKCHPVKDGEKRKIFYTLEESWGELKFYVKSTRAKAKKRPQAEIDREKRVAETHEELEQMKALHYELRKMFVDALNAKNSLAMLQAAVLVCTAGRICYTGGNRSDLMGLLGIPDDYRRDRGKQITTAFDNVDPNDYPKLIWHSMGDNAREGFNSSYKGNFPEYANNDKLEVIYTWLCWLGYEMSDDEIALRDGTHELLHRGDREESDA